MPTAFVPWGASHLAMLALFALGAALLLWRGPRWRGTPAAVRLARALALAVVAFQLPMQLYSMLPRHWDVSHSLPFQLCDLAWMAAAAALWTGARPACALTYYWGLTLTSQALLTPVLPMDFPHPQFVMFWGQHLLVVWAALHVAAGLGFRPGWRDCGFTVAVTVLWAALMLAFNAWAGTNYGYLNAKPPGRSLLDLLGPWPWYLGAELLLGLAVWALLTWPWTRRPGGPG